MSATRGTSGTRYEFPLELSRRIGLGTAAEQSRNLARTFLYLSYGRRQHPKVSSLSPSTV
jgi:hypothetical protein